MEIVCLKKYLEKFSILNEKITGKNPSLPILNSILIYTKDKNLNFLTTNLEMALESSFPCKIIKEGKLAIPAKIFSSFISSLDEEKVKLVNLNNNLVITTKNTSTTIKGYPVEDFPIVPKIKEKKSFIVSVFEFISGLKSVYYSASLSEMKPEINSVFIYSFEKVPLTFVATDSFRLAEKTIDYKFANSPNLLIPYKSVVELIRIFEGQEDDLKISFDENNCLFETRNLRFISRLIDGEFPDYKQIIPLEFVSKIILNKQDFYKNLRISSMFSGRLNEIRIKTYKNENIIELQTKNQEIGEHSVNFPCEIEGSDISVMFNYKYLIDCLNNINSEKILLKFSKEGGPLLISGLEDSSFRYLVMPMKNF